MGPIDPRAWIVVWVLGMFLPTWIATRWTAPRMAALVTRYLPTGTSIVIVGTGSLLPILLEAAVVSVLGTWSWPLAAALHTVCCLLLLPVLIQFLPERRLRTSDVQDELLRAGYDE